MLNYTCLHSVHPAGMPVPDRALTGARKRLLRTHRGAVAGCRGGVLVSDGGGPAFPSGWTCGADADAGWGLCWEGTQSCAQSFAKAGFFHQDSGKSLLAKRLVKSNKLIEVLSGVLPGQTALLVLACPSQHLQSLLLRGLLNRLF